MAKSSTAAILFIPLNCLRVALYRRLGFTIGKNVLIATPATILGRILRLLIPEMVPR